MSHQPAFDDLESLPLSLTVAEVAVVLRVSRTTVYELIHRWQATGRDGLPSYRVARCVRVPRAAVLRLLNAGSDGDTAA
jgi:excisionase family DNA binding protein